MAAVVVGELVSLEVVEVLLFLVEEDLLEERVSGIWRNSFENNSAEKESNLWVLEAAGVTEVVEEEKQLYSYLSSLHQRPSLSF